MQTTVNPRPGHPHEVELSFQTAGETGPSLKVYFDPAQLNDEGYVYLARMLEQAFYAGQRTPVSQPV